MFEQFTTDQWIQLGAYALLALGGLLLAFLMRFGLKTAVGVVIGTATIWGVAQIASIAIDFIATNAGNPEIADTLTPWVQRVSDGGYAFAAIIALALPVYALLKDRGPSRFVSFVIAAEVALGYLGLMYVKIFVDKSFTVDAANAASLSIGGIIGAVFLVNALSQGKKKAVPATASAGSGSASGSAAVSLARKD